jgi:phenylpropionate dioxygenase-like ring-hydroxylating dioxygenase large terminal subunit
MYIDPYTSAINQNTENNLIFKKVWLFAGLSTFIKNKNDYFMKSFAGESVIVRNDGENIRAFINRCPHRNARIYNDTLGNSPLYCNFHGWAFNDKGYLSSIPFEEKLYCYSAQEKSGIKLEEILCVKVGNFIFINFDVFSEDISEQFDNELLNDLELISSHMAEDISHTKIEANLNWKLMIEITMDEAHVPFVHSKTLNKARPYSPPNYSEIKMVDEEKPFLLKELSFKSEQKFEKIPKDKWHQDVDRYKDQDVYYDYYLFPNLHLASGDGGYSFWVENILPASISKTEIDIIFTTAKKIKSNRFFKIVHLEFMRHSLNLYNEDIAMMENVQTSSFNRPLSYNHGKYEYRIKRWRKYFEQLNSKGL